MTLTRRHMIAGTLAGSLLATRARAAKPLEIGWDDLIPPGVPYAEIIGEGDMDEANDTWAPVFDANATKLNERLNGELVRLPGFIIPLETSAKGVTEFMLVPYVGACIHVPPPPPNQLILATSKNPWPSDQLWDPVWAVGTMHTRLQETELALTGYALTIQSLELYEWEETN